MIVLRGGQVLSADGARLERADILVRDTRIEAIGLDVAAPADATTIDAAGRLVIPGLINAHTHSHHGMLRGVADRWTLEDLLNYGPHLTARRTPADHYLSTAIGAIEMVKSGCTAVYDVFMAPPAPTVEAMDAVLQAYRDVGLRAIVAASVSDMTFYGAVPGLLASLPVDLQREVEAVRAAPTDGILAVTEAFLRKWPRAGDDRIQVALALTVPGQSSETLLEGYARLAREHGVGIHTHLAESKVQAVYARERWGTTIVSRLHALGLLGPRFVGAHGIWLTDDDISRLADTGSIVVHNPASNLKLGSGIAPVHELCARGVTVALGADASICSDNQNIFEAMRFAAIVGNVRFPYEPDRWLGSNAVWRMATEGGGRALGADNGLGGLAPGAHADLVLLNLDSAFLRPMNHPLNTLVYAETGAAVDTVIIDGRLVLHQQRLVTVDEPTISRRVQAAAERLSRRAAEADNLAERVRPYLLAACRRAAGAPYSVNRYATSVG